MLRVVDEVVAVCANQRHLIDVGFAPERCIPRDQMMGFTLAHVGSAADAALVSGDEAPDLRWGGVAVLSAMMDDFAVRVEDSAGDGAVARIAREHGLGNDATIGGFSGVVPSEEVVELDPHVDVARHRPRTRFATFAASGLGE